MTDDMVLPTAEEHAIRERLAAATPGPWSRYGAGFVNRYTDDRPICQTDFLGESDTQIANADFIAHAPTDIARLLDALDTERTARRDDDRATVQVRRERDEARAERDTERARRETAEVELRISNERGDGWRDMSRADTIRAEVAEAALRTTREALADPEKLAQLFHETYEYLAPTMGYQTRETSAVPWNEVPESNRRLMIATCAEVGRMVLEPPQEAAGRVWNEHAVNGRGEVAPQWEEAP